MKFCNGVVALFWIYNVFTFHNLNFSKIILSVSTVNDIPWDIL